jgi:predicted hydrocarbon binding protein
MPYLPIASYPDERAIALFEALAAVSGLPLERVLDSFGTFIAPALLSYPGVKIPGNWRTLEILEHAAELEAMVQKRSEAGIKPPVLHVDRIGPLEVRIEYASALRLCGMAKGIVRGIAKNFRETITLHETSCMLLGAPACVIVVRLRGTTTTRFRATKPT